MLQMQDARDIKKNYTTIIVAQCAVAAGAPFRASRKDFQPIALPLRFWGLWAAAQTRRTATAHGGSTPCVTGR